MKGADRFFLSQRMKLLCKDEVCSVYQMKNETGDGTVTHYQVYPGISVMYNDFHMETCPPRKYKDEHIINIDHCREGRIEWNVAGGAYLYLSSGDIMLDSSANVNKTCSFPLSHYHGITISISVPEAMESIGNLLELFSIDLLALEKRFSLKEQPFIMHGEYSPDHIFYELYHVPDSIRNEYLRVKVLEMLISFKAIDPSIIGETRPYFYKTQVEKVKAIMELMTSNPDIHYTMEELSKQFDISVSSLKSCFKGVYGVAIFTYMRNYRMDLAATLLTQTDESITSIAGKVGYTNSSKFSEAFKRVKGKTPLEYRKIKI